MSFSLSLSLLSGTIAVVLKEISVAASQRKEKVSSVGKKAHFALLDRLSVNDRTMFSFHADTLMGLDDRKVKLSHG